MKTFLINKDFKINDAGNEEKIAGILPHIVIENSKDILLNLTRCIIDYPATSMLIDKILNQLIKLDGVKNFSITVSYMLPEQTLINDLLGDSKFFEIETRTEIPLPELIEKINEKIVPNDIHLKVSILDRLDEVKTTYSYGS